MLVLFWYIMYHILHTCVVCCEYWYVILFVLSCTLVVWLIWYDLCFDIVVSHNVYHIICAHLCCDLTWHLICLRWCVAWHMSCYLFSLGHLYCALTGDWCVVSLCHTHPHILLFIIFCTLVVLWLDMTCVILYDFDVVVRLDRRSHPTSWMGWDDHIHVIRWLIRCLVVFMYVLGPTPYDFYHHI